MNLNSYQKGLISIVIPVRFRQDLLKVALDSIFKYTTEEFELILVCDGVKYSFLNEYKIKIIYNETPLGFAKTVNKGIKETKGEYVLILNSDVVVIPNWLTELLKTYDKFSKAGMIVPTLSEDAGMQSIELNKQEGDYSRGDLVKGVCMLLKRELINKIGLLDERFDLGGGEDSDYCMRVKEAGYEVIVARKSFLYHYNSASFRELFNNDIDYSKKYSSQQFSKFKEKWKEKLNNKPKIFIAIPNNGFISQELAQVLVIWSHDFEFNIKIFTPSGLSPLDAARNYCVKEFLEGYEDYLLFIDNDIVPPIHALKELIAANKEIISPICFMWQKDDNDLMFPCLVSCKYDEKKEYKPYYGSGVEETDTITGGMFLIKREVLEKMERPFAFTYHKNGTVIYSEDFYFSREAQKLGYKLYTNYNLICKHYKNVDLKDINNTLLKYGR